MDSCNQCQLPEWANKPLWLASPVSFTFINRAQLYSSSLWRSKLYFLIIHFFQIPSLLTWFFINLIFNFGRFDRSVSMFFWVLLSRDYQLGFSALHLIGDDAEWSRRMLSLHSSFSLSLHPARVILLQTEDDSLSFLQVFTRKEKIFWIKKKHKTRQTSSSSSSYYLGLATTCSYFFVFFVFFVQLDKNKISPIWRRWDKWNGPN